MAGHSNRLTLARLDSLSLNQRELRRFLETDVGKQINSKISVAVTQYMRMMQELQYMEEKLPGLLVDLKTIQQKVDKRHKRSNIATVGGCATSIVGGAMIIGGIAAAPFTFGASIGLTAAGTAVTAAGSITTTVAKTGDFILGASDFKKTNKMVDEFFGHYKAAKEAYEMVNKICQELTAVLPTLEGTQNAKGISATLNAIASAAGFAIDSARMPKTAISSGLNALTICKAVVSPAELHAATRLATTPAKALPLTRQFLVEAVGAAKYATRLDASGFRVAVTASFRTVGVMIRTAGVALAVGGIILDAYSLFSAGKELYKDKKCKVSQNISKHIKQLEDLGHGLEELNQQLAANIKPVTD